MPARGSDLGGPHPRFEVIRDPLWDNIRLDEAAVAVLDTPDVQRLRYVRQLGHAFLVYPGATHSRFEHALGTYHLTRRALAILGERGELDIVPEEDRLAARLAALLHDIGHYPFSHSLEEAGFPHHEKLGAARLTRPELAGRIAELGGAGLADRVAAFIEGRSSSPLAGLISGTLDLDKIDYLSRDARMCGVPYGSVDVDRLLASLTLCHDGVIEVGIHEKGVSALESLLFAKYQMYRNVYWHHAVRSATCMFKRAVRDAVDQRVISPEEISQATDGGIMERLITNSPEGLATAVHHRKLYKRALDLPASDLPAGTQSWLWDAPDLVRQVEDAVAASVGLMPGELLIDLPSRRGMLDVDLPLKTRAGAVDRLTAEGKAGQLGLPRVADQLYQIAQRLRVFTARRPPRPVEAVADLVSLSEEEVRERLAADRPLLGR